MGSILMVFAVLAMAWIVIGIGFYLGAGAGNKGHSLFIRLAIVLLWPLAGVSVDLEEGRRKRPDEDEPRKGPPLTPKAA